jgi:hypothetical protein
MGDSAAISCPAGQYLTPNNTCADLLAVTGKPFGIGWEDVLFFPAKVFNVTSGLPSIAISAGVWFGAFYLFFGSGGRR